MSAEALAVAPTVDRPSLVAKFAARFGVEPNKMISTLKATAFRQSSGDEVSNEQMMALLVVADQYGLNPWTRELYAFPDKQRGIVPIVSVDGWSRIINDHADFDGVEFSYGPASEKHKGAPEWIDCTIHRKDRHHATTVRERLVECYRDTQPWNSHPGRMLRHKALIQCSRTAFGFAGIYDEDEAQRIVEGTVARITESPAIAAINDDIRPPKTDPESVETSKPAPTPATPGEEPEPVTYAQVAQAIQASKTADELDVAVDLISGIESEKQRAELDVEARAKRKAIAK